MAERWNLKHLYDGDDITDCIDFYLYHKAPPIGGAIHSRLEIELTIYFWRLMMRSIQIEDVIKAVKGKCNSDNTEKLINRVCTDSRKINKNDLYIALEGEVFDGHDFVNSAIENGATAVVVSKQVDLLKDIPLILVEDTQQALWDLATYYRTLMAKPVIAITGSVGKTSTKDMVATTLGARFNVHKSQGNFNNHIGMPMTLLGLEEAHDLAVVEMGMRGLGEIQALTHIARPNIGIITNIGISHIERLGSQDNILKAKLEIVEGLDESGLLILNANDPMLSQVNPNIYDRIVYIGIDTPCHYQAYSVIDKGEEGVSFKIQLQGEEYDINIPAVGKHNVHNALFGIACGIELGMRPKEIVEGIQTYVSEKMRLNIIEKDGIKFIDDCYNASPDSMKAGLQVLRSLAKQRATAVLGNMFELGDMASEAHCAVGQLCAELNIDFTAIIGENAQDLARGIGDETRYAIFDSHEEIVDYLKVNLSLGDVVFIKGSRGMKMERILELW